MSNCGVASCRKCSPRPRCLAGPRCKKCYPERWRGKQAKTKFETDLARTSKQVVKK